LHSICNVSYDAREKSDRRLCSSVSVANNNTERTVSKNYEYLLYVCTISYGGEKRRVQGKPEGKRPHGRPWCRWEDIKMVFRKCDEGAWSGLIWLRTQTGSGHL